MLDLVNARYKDPNLDPKERVDDLISYMTLEEKVAQMMCIWNGKREMLVDEQGNFDYEKAKQSFKHGHGIGQIGRPSDAGKDEESGHDQGLELRETVALTNAIQKFFIEHTRLGIPVFFHEECLHGLAAKGATSFPQPIALAGTFNTKLIEQLYSIAAKETRDRGAHQALTPVVDVARDPRWGRVEETFGEDPYLVSEMGKAAVRGFQGDSRFKNKDKVVATLKHFAAHGQPESGTNCAPANISERVLRETFLMPFKEAIQEAGVISIMPSYNEIDGIPSHANEWLLNDVLREEWGFNGYLVSDYYAIQELYHREATHGHHVAVDKKQAAELAIHAGINLELPEPDCYTYLFDLIDEKKVEETAIDELIKPLLFWKFKMGLFENPYTDVREEDQLESKKALALQAAEESIILLKNNSNILPLSKDNLKKLAVIGPNAHVPLLGGYSGEPKKSVTILQGIKEHLGNSVEVLFHEGCKITVDGRWEKDEVVFPNECEELESIAEAVAIAKNTDAILLAIGGNDQTSREAWSKHHMGDRTSLDLIGYQKTLVDELKKLDKPLVILVCNGRPLSITDVSQKADALLECWYGGQEAGLAIARVIFGEVNPSGKLSISIPRSVGQLPIFYNYKPSARRGFLDEEKTPLYPFGFGLSYTKFELSDITLADDIIHIDESTNVKYTITNVGKTAGYEVIQMYIRDVHSSVTRPIKELKGFQKIWLEAGESKDFSFPISPNLLSFYDIHKNYVVEPGEFHIMIGNSSQDVCLVSSVLTVIS